MVSRGDKPDQSEHQQRRRHRRKKDKHRRKSSSKSISPPSYSVVEGVDGKLVNPTLNVIWPDRPAAGRHSINEYLKRRAKASVVDDQITEETRVSMNDKNDASDSSKKSRRYVKEPDELLEVDELTERSQRIDFVEQQALERKRGDKDRKQHEREKKKKKKEKKSKRRSRKSSSTFSDNEKIGSLVSLGSYEPLPSSSDLCDRRQSRKKESRKTSNSIKSNSSFSSFSLESNERGSSIIVPPSIQSHFAGVQQESTIHKFLRPTQFVLYYKRANVSTLDELPHSIPLIMAYMSNRNIVHHFPVNVDTRHDGRTFWHVDLGSTNKNQQPYFSSMSALISFYEGFVSLKKNGDVEVFPVSDSDS